MKKHIIGILILSSCSTVGTYTWKNKYKINSVKLELKEDNVFRYTVSEGLNTGTVYGEYKLINNKIILQEQTDSLGSVIEYDKEWKLSLFKNKLVSTENKYLFIKVDSTPR